MPQHDHYAHSYKRMQAPTQDEVETEIVDKQRWRYDTNVVPQQLNADLTRQFENGEEKTPILEYREERRVRTFDFSGDAETQLLSKIRVPVSFYRRCPNNLKHQIFNHFNPKHVNDYMFRMDPGPPQKDSLEIGPFVDVSPEHVRAVLSPDFCAIDDHTLYPVIFKALEEYKGVRFKSFTYDNRLTQLVVSFEDAQLEYNGQLHQAGIIISNSETGHSAIWIEPVVHIPSCSFVHRSILEAQGANCRIIHRGDVDIERVTALVKQAYEIAQVGIMQLIEAEKTTVTKDHALRFATSIDSFPKRLKMILEEEWQNEEQIIKAEAARRIILLAQELPLFQRVQVEQKAGQLVGLFKGFKARIAAIQAEIEHMPQIFETEDNTPF